MYLKKIEINGFKSFAEKTEIVINSNVTGVVGPNGSGKSNIADAIRWVLGEQSSKNLRGEKMEDVIFHGTEKRQRKSFCQVSLVFDNQDMRIPCDYSEIVISRKMYRSGDCDYLLNGSLVRLRDILEMIRDTGIGKEGYSIIGQGRIEEILASKPTARRKVFEEAAGIMKFRIRKEEAEKKLAKTGENLVRVKDILDELETQLGPMEEQASRTREYLGLYDQQRTLDANVYLTTYEKSSARIQTIEESLAAVQEELSQGDAQTSREEIDALSKALEKWEKEYDQTAGSKSALAAEAERVGGQRQLAEERIKSAREQLEKLSWQAEGDQSGKAEREEQLAQLREALAGADEKIAQYHREESRMAEERDRLAAAMSQAAQRMESLQSQRMELLSQLSEENSSLSRTAAELSGMNDRKRELQERLAENAQEVEERRTSFCSERAEAQDLDQRKQALVTKLNENKMLIVQEKDLAAGLEQKLAAVGRAQQDAKTKRKLLLELKAEYEGYSDSVKKLMKAGKQDPALGRRLIGTVAELIETPDEYAAAIEAILGGALQNVVVKDEYDAKYAIQFLRERRLGRVTFLPSKALKIGYLSQREEKAARQTGFLAIASQAVQCGPEARPAVDYLLARTIIVDNMDNAIKIMRDGGYSFRAVTLEGDVLRPGGSMTGGSVQKNKFDLLARDRQIHGLEQKIQDLEAQRAEADQALARQREKIAQQKAQGEILVKELQDTEISIAAEREKMTSSDALLETAEARGKTLESQMEVLALSLDQLEERKARLEASIQEKNSRLSLLQNQLAQPDSQLDHKSRLDELAQGLNGIAIKKAEQAKDTEAARENRRRIEGELAQMAAEWENRERQRQSLAGQEQALQAEQAELARREREIQGSLSRSEEALLRAEGEKQRLREELQRKQKDMADFQLKQGELMESKFKLENQRDKVQTALEAAEAKLWEEYELTYRGAEKLRTDMPYSQCVKELQGIRGRIRELGPVNPSAIEEYEKLRDRAAEMGAQRDDLTKAQEDLTKVIGDLMASMKEIFIEKFAAINRNFMDIFQELFGGGRAKLSLEEGDIMECGIQIEAEPPGKKLQHMSLLSGGERALTAIALLFAMIKINPSPVCLLDEIDAPLDDSNLVRFGTYLRGLRDSQFLIITHRKPTMSLCDALYGVAMEEKGVSKLVSVKINQ